MHSRLFLTVRILNNTQIQISSQISSGFGFDLSLVLITFGSCAYSGELNETSCALQLDCLVN